MGSRDSWIDPEEVSDLAGEIYPEEKSPAPQEGEDGEYRPLPLLDDDDLTAADEAVAEVSESTSTEAEDGDQDGTAERIGERLRAIRRRAERSGLLVGAEKEKEPGAEGEPDARSVIPLPEPFVLRGGRMLEQVRALVEWLADGFERVFVLDELGDELVPGEVPAGLRSGAVRLAQSWERSQQWLREDGQAAGAPVASAALADGKVISVVGVRCASGFYCAALVGDQMISIPHAIRVEEALFLVFG